MGCEGMGVDGWMGMSVMTQPLTPGSPPPYLPISPCTLY
jgi:hypothetical protein